MVLGTAGNHPSVFHIGDSDGNSGQNSHIVNSCLSLIHSYMSSRDKQYIKGIVCSTFSLEKLKEARECIFKYAAPDADYKYRGPNSKQERDKISDAFEGIFAKLVKLDAEDNLPTFSVPSVELAELLTINGNNQKNHDSRFKDYDKKFENMESQIEEIKKTFHSFVSVVTSSNQPQLPINRSIPPVIRNRLLSTGSKRSASEISSEDESVSVADSQDFQLPRNQRKKAKRAKKNNANETVPLSGYSTAVKKVREKPKSTWGTIQPTSRFKGAVPELFLYNCDRSVTSDDVLDYFKCQDINIRTIEKKSHVEAARSSFRISPSTQEEYDLISDGSVLPKGMAVRKFIPPRWKPNSERQSITNSQVNEAINSSQIQALLRHLDTESISNTQSNEMDIGNVQANNDG